MKGAAQVTTPKGFWKDAGSDDDKKSRLLGILYLDGQPMHMAAYAVKKDVDIQEAEDSWFVEDLNHCYVAFEPGGAFNTTEIGGREYVIFTYPMT